MSSCPVIVIKDHFFFLSKNTMPEDALVRLSFVLMTLWYLGWDLTCHLREILFLCYKIRPWFGLVVSHVGLSDHISGSNRKFYLNEGHTFVFAFNMYKVDKKILVSEQQRNTSGTLHWKHALWVKDHACINCTEIHLRITQTD